MRASVAKAKGRRLQDKVALKFRELFHGILENGDIVPQPMGQHGTDVILSPAAKRIIAYDIECKNVEQLVGAKLTEAIEQCETNTQEGRIPLLVFKRNQQPERVILRLDDFLALVYPNKDVMFGMTAKQRVIVELERLKQQVLDG